MPDNARTAIVQTPGDIEARVARLSSHFNDLRNAALGRGTQPLVSPPLATLVGDRFERFRNWYEGISFASELVPGTIWDDVAEQEKIYNETRSLVLRELPASAVPQPLDVVTRTKVEDIAAAAGMGFGKAVLLAGGVYLAYRAVKKRGVFGGYRKRGTRR